MKSLLYIGGPLILFTWFAIHADLITFANEKPGVIHHNGLALGGTFFGVDLKKTDTYYCDEGGNCTLVDSTTEVTEIEGLELEEEAIEYREGTDTEHNKTKQPGLAKYADIRLGSLPTGINWEAWKFTFEHRAEMEALEEEYEGDLRELLKE